MTISDSNARTDRRVADQRVAERRVVTRGTRGTRAGVPVIEGAAAQIRPARLDNPLRRTAMDPTYSDPVLEEIVALSARQAREDARAEGYAAGWAQGRQAAAAEAGKLAATLAERDAQQQADDRLQVTTLLGQLGTVALAARAPQRAEWAEVADAIAETAVQLAQAILDRELAATDSAVLHGVQTALARIADPDAAVVHLNPADAAVLVKDVLPGVRVIPDPAVQRGGVVVLTPTQRLRVDLPAALAAAREVLSA